MDEIRNAWWAALDTDEDGRAARPLLCAAVDATRAGHRGPLPRSLLTAAMRDYAPDPGSGASPDLVERGLARAALLGPGVRAFEPRDDGFAVDAAAVAAVTAARPGALPAPALWGRARRARERPRRPPAHRARGRAAQPVPARRRAVPAPGHGRPCPAWMILARRLDNDTMTGATAEACLRHAAGLGEPAALFALGQRLQSTRRHDEGAGFIRRAAEAGHPPAMGNWASTLERAGQRAKAAVLYERAASPGDPERMYLWGSALVKAGDAPRGEAWLARAADAGHGLALRQLDELLRRHGREAEADEQLHRRAAADVPYAMVLLGMKAGGAEGQRWLERAAEAGDTTAMTILADQLFAQGGPERAEAWLVRAIRADNTWALRTLLERHAGELERCERIAYFLELAAACSTGSLPAEPPRLAEPGLTRRAGRRAADQARLTMTGVGGSPRTSCSQTVVHADRRSGSRRSTRQTRRIFIARRGFYLLEKTKII